MTSISFCFLLLFSQSSSQIQQSHPHLHSWPSRSHCSWHEISGYKVRDALQTRGIQKERERDLWWCFQKSSALWALGQVSYFLTMTDFNFCHTTSVAIHYLAMEKRKDISFCGWKENKSELLTYILMLQSKKALSIIQVRNAEPRFCFIRLLLVSGTSDLSIHITSEHEISVQTLLKCALFSAGSFMCGCVSLQSLLQLSGSRPAVLPILDQCRDGQDEGHRPRGQTRPTGE